MRSSGKKTGSYDWVNESDEIVGHGPASEGHARGLYTRSVHILLQNLRGEVLICKRPKVKKSYPLLYTSSAGGHVEQDEKYEAAALRELEEELGIVVPLTDAGRFDVVNDTERAIHRLFVGKIIEAVLKTDPQEIESYRFADLESLRRDVLEHSEIYAHPFQRALYQFISWKQGST